MSKKNDIFFNKFVKFVIQPQETLYILNNIYDMKYNDESIEKPIGYINMKYYFYDIGKIREITFINCYYYKWIFKNFFKLWGAISLTLDHYHCFSLRVHKQIANFIKNVDDDGKGDHVYEETINAPFFTFYENTTLSQIIENNYKNKKYNFFCKIDIKNFFPSIYSHTLQWIVDNDFTKGKYLYDNNQSHHYFLKDFEKIITLPIRSETNGIPIGPELSRLFAECLMGKIDWAVYYELENLHEKDYEVIRYVDDIYIFSESENTIENIRKFYEKKLKNIKLYLKETTNKSIYNFKDLKYYYNIRKKVKKLLKRYKFSMQLQNKLSKYIKKFSIKGKEQKEIIYMRDATFVSYIFSILRKKSKTLLKKCETNHKKIKLNKKIKVDKKNKNMLNKSLIFIIRFLINHCEFVNYKKIELLLVTFQDKKDLLKSYKIYFKKFLQKYLDLLIKKLDNNFFTIDLANLILINDVILKNDLNDVVENILNKWNPELDWDNWVLVTTILFFCKKNEYWSEEIEMKFTKYINKVNIELAKYLTEKSSFDWKFIKTENYSTYATLSHYFSFLNNKLKNANNSNLSKMIFQLKNVENKDNFFWKTNFFNIFMHDLSEDDLWNKIIESCEKWNGFKYEK
ncbi:hypothetical protein SHELI_v1c10010 [Spiroplasma helicoides]|uniref:Reverse transcriptase domain-containing protein n=1 Tax=Spiroplasma helicoides TaxID=216938 RepID=A0A1B3SLZ1_9MOLU|nr:RNA-directed DNA polymerase [Spiroplasma helicoides]AOG60948.1 hypothetical protein SHELI_v1c10010 [Spiroplasma helicoides]